LICDTNPRNLVMLQSILSKNAYDVVSANDGHEVIDKIKTLQYDLALVATDMPGMDGFQVSRLIKESDQTRHIPVMILSSLSDHVTRNHAIESGADEFLVTPFNRVELLARVVTLLRIKNLYDTLQRQIAEKEEEKAKLLEKTNELRILSEIARMVISTKDQRATLAEITNIIPAAFKAEACCIVLRQGTDWVLETASRQVSRDLVGAMIDVPTLYNVVLQNEKPLIINDAPEDTRGTSELSKFLGFKIRSILSSPIFVRGAMIGALQIINKRNELIFETTDISLLMTLSGQIALAIENRQLFDKLSSFNKNLQTQITEATQEVVDLKNFNESIIQNISSGLLTVDFAGRVLFANKAAATVLGYDEWELTDALINDIFGNAAGNILMQPTVNNDESPRSEEIIVRNKQSEEIYLGYTTTLRYDRDKNKVGCIISFRDITQMKEMRVTILRMDRLVSLGMLTSGIAHEIRNPLAGIKTMAQALEKELGSDDSRMEYVQRIIKQINRLNELLKAFFTYAKPVRPEKKYCDLQMIVKEVRALVHQRSENDKIRIEELYDPYLPKLYVDESQLEQVLINLFINAMDAIRQNGTLTIEAQTVMRLLPPQFREEGKLIQIKITDTGSGISKDNLRSIFDPFFTTKPNGVGLGLSIVYRIIHEHGGDVLVDSIEKHGTTFTILLPLEKESVLAANQKALAV